MNLPQRVFEYHKAFPKFPVPQVVNGRIEALWIMGNSYQTSGYFGAYPHGYLDRIMSMFPDMKEILHVPSGSLPPGEYTRVDIRPECNPDFVHNCEDLKSLFPEPKFDLALVDIPYSVEDAEHYGTPMVSRKKTLQSIHDVLVPGGWCIFLDQVLPIWSKKNWSWNMAIGMIKSSNHRVRGVFGFQKHDHTLKTIFDSEYEKEEWMK